MRALASTSQSAILLTLLMACSPPGEPGEGSGQGAAEDSGPQTRPIEVVTLETTAFEEQIELFGETEPVRAAFVSAQVGGRIVSLDLVEGEPVEADAVVMRLSASQLTAQINRLDVVIDQLDNDIERTVRLIERGLSTEATLEQLRTEREANRETIREVRTYIRETRHLAPIGGTVSQVDFESGEFVAQGVPVARIVDLSQIVVTAGLPERDIAFVRTGMQIPIRIEATHLDRVGTVHRIGLEANPRNRTFPIEIRLDNADGAIRGGMRATATLPRVQLDQAIVIPRDAILQAVDGSEVFVVEDEIAQAREVEVGASQGRFAVITAGLQSGDVLVVRGQRSLVTGELVSLSRNEPCCRAQFDSYLGRQAE